MKILYGLKYTQCVLHNAYEPLGCVGKYGVLSETNSAMSCWTFITFGGADLNEIMVWHFLTHFTYQVYLWCVGMVVTGG
jgi:hypothetical protein